MSFEKHKIGSNIIIISVCIIFVWVSIFPKIKFLQPLCFVVYLPSVQQDKLLAQSKDWNEILSWSVSLLSGSVTVLILFFVTYYHHSYG